jgi:hypothetical protein
MKKEYDFTNARRGALIPVPKNKVRITIRIDSDILDWFQDIVDKAGGGNYQTLMNDALRAYMDMKDGSAESLVRKVVREELAGYSVRKKKQGRPKTR